MGDKDEGPVAAAIRSKLTAAFAPSRLEIEDESHRHAHHAGATRPDGTRGETHFRVAITSEAFAGMSRVAQQRAVYGVLAEEMAATVHALALTVAAR
jgi:BolA family transcriptional regulator, general stress-responsive regulator